MKLRGALLGAGNIALRGHAPQWTGDKSLKQSVEIVAVADLSPANLEAARAALPGARQYANAEELLEREPLDFCDICTPPFTHLALVQAAASRRLHVVCEKPIAPDLAAAEAIARAVRRAGLVFAPCHQYHHSPLWLAVKERLPRLGRIYLAEYEVSRTEANPGNPNWTPSWRTDPNLAGGGILFDHGAHIFYQLRSALGEPERVQASVRTLRHTGYGVEDTAFVTLERDEWLTQVRLTWAARKREIRFRFVGEQGELSGDDQQLRLHGEKTEEVSFAEGMSKDSAHSAWFAPLFRSFVDRVRAGDTSTEALDEAVYVSRLVACAYESSRQARALNLTALPAGTAPDVAPAPARA